MKELTVYLATDQNLARNTSNGKHTGLELAIDKKLSNQMKPLKKFEPKHESRELSSEASKTAINKENLFNLIASVADDLKIVLLVTNDAGRSRISHGPKWKDYLVCNINPDEIEKLVRQLNHKRETENADDMSEMSDVSEENEKKLSEKFELTETEIEILKTDL